MLLRMRSLPPKTTVRPDNGTLKAVEGSDEDAVRWFDMIQISRMFGPTPVDGAFSDYAQLTTSKNVPTPSSTQATPAPLISATLLHCFSTLSFLLEIAKENISSTGRMSMYYFEGGIGISISVKSTFLRGRKELHAISRRGGEFALCSTF